MLVLLWKYALRATWGGRTIYCTKAALPVASRCFAPPALVVAMRVVPLVGLLRWWRYGLFLLLDCQDVYAQCHALPIATSAMHLGMIMENQCAIISQGSSHQSDPWTDVDDALLQLVSSLGQRASGKHIRQGFEFVNEQRCLACDCVGVSGAVQRIELVVEDDA